MIDKGGLLLERFYLQELFFFYFRSGLAVCSFRL
jgi:hypothetical protein